MRKKLNQCNKEKMLFNNNYVMDNKHFNLLSLMLQKN